MAKDIIKFGILWTEREAKTNTLYTVKEESLYNSCKQWFMLVQDKNSQTQYLAFHNTSKQKNQIVTHIRTSTYSKKQKLYEIANISLNKGPNLPPTSKKDYDTIFDNKNLYAIPEQYLDIIGKIDPDMTQYIEQHKRTAKQDTVKQDTVTQGNYSIKDTAKNLILYGPPRNRQNI